MESTVKEKLRKLQGTQDTIVSTANYLIENSAHSRLIVKAWNQEFANANHEKKLTLLYLANDVLQRCKTHAFLTDFLHYLPKATAHLYKYGNKELRSNLDRLVEVWTERKVLRSQGIAAVRNQLAKVKSTALDDTEENQKEMESKQKMQTQQGSKRKRIGHPIIEAVEDVQEIANKTKTTGIEIQDAIGKNELNALSKDQLTKLKELAEQHCAMVKNEIQIRKRTVDLLKETLNEQEEGLKKSKEMLRLCFVQQADIKKVLDPLEHSGLPPPPQQQQQQQQQQKAQVPQQAILEDIPNLSNEMNVYHGGGVNGIAIGCSGGNGNSIPHTLPYALSMMGGGSELCFRPPTHVGHPSFGAHSNIRPIHTGSFFPVHHPDQPPEKPQEHDIANVYHPNPPFMPPDYIQDTAQGHQMPTYGTHLIQGMHGGGGGAGTYVHPLTFQGYPEQYDPEKEWGAS